MQQHAELPCRGNSWELNNFVWTNYNPGNVFPNNSNFTATQNASFLQLGLNQSPLPAPHPVAGPPRQEDQPQLPPAGLERPRRADPAEVDHRHVSAPQVDPAPRAVDTPEELAQLSQFVINIIDFRDPDCTMTHWQNPDVLLVPGQPANPSASAPMPATAPTLVLASSNPANAIPLDQYGMEYNPVALNEVLAFSYAYYQGGVAGQPVLRRAGQHADAVGLRGPAAPAGGTNPPDPSILDLGGLQYTPGDPYSGGCWDLVFTDDTPNSRPDPYRGELVLGGQFYALIPLNKDSFTASPAGATAGTSSSPGSDVTLVPLGPAGVPLPSAGNPASTPPTPPTNFFYAFGNSPPNPAFETGTPSPTTYYPTGDSRVIAANTPSLVQYLSPAGDPFNRPATPKITWYPGVLPGVVADPGTSPGSPPPNYQSKLPTLIAGSAADEVLLGLPAPARQPVRPSVRGQSHAGCRRHALPLYRRHRADRRAKTAKHPREHGLFGPAVPALSRRPRRPRRGGHTGRRSPRAAAAGCPLRLHRADRGRRRDCPICWGPRRLTT